MRLILIFVFFGFIGCNSKKNTKQISAAPASTTVNGEQLFTMNCSQCHKPAQDFTGPALAGVTQRWKSKTLLYEFVRSSEDVIPRDAYAMALYKKWNQAYMQPFSNLSNHDIDAILSYCNAQVRR